MNKKNFTLSEIFASYNENKKKEEKGALWLYYVIRKFSFYPTWLFLKLGISANQATYISIAIGILGCALMAFGSYDVKIIGALLVNVWFIIDCVDGNIARCRKSFSRYGDFIDTLSGYIMYTLLFISVGIAAFNYSDSLLVTLQIKRNTFLTLGIWSSFANIFPRLIYQKFMNTFQDARSTVSTHKSNTKIYHIIYNITHNIGSFAGFLAPILLFVTIFRLWGTFSIFYALINTGILLITSARNILKAKNLDQ